MRSYLSATSLAVLTAFAFQGMRRGWRNVAAAVAVGAIILDAPGGLFYRNPAGADPLRCDLTKYKPAAGLTAAITGDLLVLTSKGQQEAIHALRISSEEAQGPLLRLEHSLHALASFAIMPLFALANAGVRVTGGGVGIGRSLHARQVLVADGTPEMRLRIERVLTNDPGLGVARHADAGYPEALATAEEYGIRLPMRERVH